MEGTKKQKEIIDELISILNQFKFVDKLSNTSRHIELYNYKLKLLKLNEEDHHSLGNAIDNIYRVICINKE